MDYEAMWTRLREELLHLTAEGVKTIDPHIILDYMTFIEEIEEIAKTKAESKIPI